MLLSKYYGIYVEVPSGHPGVFFFYTSDMAAAWAFARKQTINGHNLAILDILEAR